VVKEPKRRITFGSIKRKDLKNMVTISSGVTEGANANEVVEAMKLELANFLDSDAGEEFQGNGFNAKFTGQMEQQAKEMSFLSTALLIAVFLILLIIVTQFNSFSSPAIILLAVILSLTGVFLGLLIFRQDFVIIMTMIGIISLAGIVVNNAIVLIDYTNLLRKERKEELGLSETEQLPVADVKQAIIKGGQTRLRPVLLTAITTVLGLLPLATGLNIDFVAWFATNDPGIYIGGDNVIFFGPMSWTIIYGLTFATFLTLIIVPVTYYLLYRLKRWIFRVGGWTMRSQI
jgi:multidrug efflux pump subunit AcrB